jgi:hypothetical protein
MQLGANAPLSGDALQQIVEHSYQAPPKVIDRLKQLLGQ